MRLNMVQLNTWKPEEKKQELKDEAFHLKEKLELKDEIREEVGVEEGETVRRIDAGWIFFIKHFEDGGYIMFNIQEI